MKKDLTTRDSQTRIWKLLTQGIDKDQEALFFQKRHKLEVITPSVNGLSKADIQAKDS